MNLINQNNLSTYTKMYTGMFFNTNYKDGWSLTIDKSIRYFSAAKNTSGSANYTAWIISCGAHALLKYDDTTCMFVLPTTSYLVPKSRIDNKTIIINKEWIDQTNSSIAYSYVILA